MFNIIKNDILLYFDLYKLMNAKTAKDKIGAFLKIITFLITMVLFSITIYYIIHPSVNDYKKADLMYLIIAQYFAIASSFLIGSNIQKIDDLLFKFKDYDLLVPLPIKKNKIILAKLITLYIFNVLYTIIFLISPYLIYIKNVDVNLFFHFKFFITLFIIPIVPVIIATILGIIFTFLQSLYKENKALNIILTIIMFLVILIASFLFINIGEKVETGLEMVNVFNRIYPLTSIYINMLIFDNLLSTLLFIIIPLILFIIYSVVINKYHTTLYNRINYYNVKKIFKYNKFIKHNQLYALYKKELKRFFSSNLYTMNSSIGSVILTLLTMLYIFAGRNYLDIMIGKNNLLLIIEGYTPLFISSFIILNASTQSSISLEGNYIGILKSLPVRPGLIILSKILVNMTIGLPAIILNATLLILYIRPNNIFFFYYTPFIYLLFISLIGIRLNLKYPKFNYKSELQIIKQSIPSILTLAIGVFIAVMPFSDTLPNFALFYTFIQTRLIEIVTFILGLELIIKHKKLFKKL